MITITYNALSEDDTRKTFEAIRILKQNGIDEIAHLPIVQENADTWRAEQDKKIAIIQEWAVGAVMVRGKQCRYNDIVYNIVQGHTVTNEAYTPDVVPALYRPAPTIAAGQRYPSWDSIGHLDSENFWKEGEQVYHNDKEWVSKNAVNIWEPGTVGSDVWEEIGGEIVEPETYPEWDSTQHWSTYSIGDRRTWNGAVYECKDPQWAQSYAPDTAAGLQYGWTKLYDL